MSFKIGSLLNSLGSNGNNQILKTTASTPPLVAPTQNGSEYEGGSLSVTIKPSDTQRTFAWRGLYQHARQAGLDDKQAKEFANKWIKPNSTYNHRGNGQSEPYTDAEFNQLKTKGTAPFELNKDYDSKILADLNERVAYEAQFKTESLPAYTPEERAALEQQKSGASQSKIAVANKPLLAMIDARTKDGKPLTEDAALTRYIERTYNPPDANGNRRVWGDKINEMVNQAKLQGVKVGNLQVSEDGQTATFGINAADKQKLDRLFNQALGETIKGEQACLKGQQEATNQVTDIGRMYVNGAVNTVNHITEPARGMLEVAGVDTSAAKLPKLEYKSEYGKKNGVAGEIGTEMGIIGLTAPTALKTTVGKVVAGVSGAYNVSTGAAGIDPTEKGETTRYREMGTLERGFRIVGGAGELLGVSASIGGSGKAGTTLAKESEAVEALADTGTGIKVPVRVQTATTEAAIEGAMAKPTQTAEELASEMAGKSGSSGGRAIIGRRAQAAEIASVTEELAAKGIKVIKNADKQLDKANRGAAAAFDFEKGELLLRKDATFLETFHEKTHALQWAELGKENYVKLGRMAREEHVYKTIMENKQLFTQRELDHAKYVIEDYRIKKSMGRID